VTSPALDQHFRRAGALRAEAAQYLTPQVWAEINAQLSCQDRIRNLDESNGVVFEKWRPIATGPAAKLLNQANDYYWKVVVQMDGLCRKKALVHHRRLKYDFEELHQAAREGCHRAAIRFDPDKGYKFSTYADGWIRVACDRCRNLDHDLSIGVQAAVSGGWVKARASRLDAPIKQEEGSALLIDRVAADEVEGPDVVALARLRTVMDELELTEIERACLENIGDDGPTLAEIGKRFGRSREWMRQIRDKALEKIKAAMRTQKEPMINLPARRKTDLVDGVCIIDGCDRTQGLSRGLCKSCYGALGRWGIREQIALPHKYPAPPPPSLPSVEIDDRGEGVCLQKGCEASPRKRGFCQQHYGKARTEGVVEKYGRPVHPGIPPMVRRAVPIEEVCLIEGCDLSPDCRGLCISHYNKALKEQTLSRFALPSTATSTPRPRRPRPKVAPPKPIEAPLPTPNPEPPPKPTIQLTRDDLWRRYELLNRADAIRAQIDALAPLSVGGIEIALTPALSAALREHADALESSALQLNP